MATPKSDPWDTFRRQMPVVGRWAFFDHAADAPIPEPTRQAILRWADEAATEGGMAWPRWNRRLQEVREFAAQWVNASPEEIALIRSTTEGINLVAEGLDWRPGDNVVTLADEFPSNQYPWLNQVWRGIEVRRVPTDEGRVGLDRLAGACDSRTRVVSISWVGYVSGWRNDLEQVAEIAHRHGAFFFLDAIQGLGAFPLDVAQTPVDFFSADGHKWMLGPEGAGLFYIRRELLDRLRPTGIGWNSVAHARDFTRIELEFRPSAERFEGGAPNSVGFIGLGASLELLAGYGADAIGARILAVTDYACEELRRIGAVLYSQRDDRERCSGIVTFELPGFDAREARRVCLERGVALSFRSSRLRISAHAYNNEEDVARLIEAIEAARKA
ncbi:MAG: aminotransferase class V-fold PLP-dependent enzyme [Pirellulales bacterium]